jgi:hypothetical protein
MSIKVVYTCIAMVLHNICLSIICFLEDAHKWIEKVMFSIQQLIRRQYIEMFVIQSSFDFLAFESKFVESFEFRKN